MNLGLGIAPVAALAAGPALADFGAIAYAPSTGGYGVAWGTDAAETGRTALAECAGYGADCAVTLAFRNACGALARGAAGAHAAASAATPAQAEARALAACGRLAAGCEIEVSFCSNR